MAKLTPFLLFDGDCAEAMSFYQACFGGTLSITRVSESPMAADVPPEHQGRVINASLVSGDIVITATDWLHRTRKPLKGNMVSVLVRSEDYSEIESIFKRLSDGADPELLDPLSDRPFGTYGHLVDRFGVGWFFVGPKIT